VASLPNDLILNAVTEGVISIDAAGRITFANEAGGRLLGYRPAEMTGKEHHALLHHSRAEGVPYPESRCPISATLSDGSVHHASGEVFWRKDGKPVPVDYTSAPIREEGKLVGAVVIFADVSERSHAEEIARRANQKILEIYERIPEAFFALDREFRLVYMNPVAERMRHTPKEAVMGKVLWDAFPDLKDTRFFGEYHRAMAEMKPVTVEEHYPRMGMWFEATAYPAEDGLSIFFRDVTLRKRMEEEAKTASISRPLVRKIVQDLVETGGVAHQILQQVGRKLAAENTSPTVADYLKSYTDMGLGKIEIEKEEGQRYAFRGTDLLEKRPGSRVATCSFTLGFLSEAVSHLNHDETTLGTEIECQSRGAPSCRFIVQVKKPEEGLARRVKELV
jgi:PAS domain S-box-containing protein